MTLAILRPDNAAVSEFRIEHAFDYPLDSILVIAACENQVVNIGRALRLLERAPWFPVVVRLPSSGGPIAVVDIGETAPAIARVGSTAGSRGDAEQIRAVARSRGAPTVAQFRGIAERRFGARIGMPVERAISKAVLTRPGRRILREHGPFTASEWCHLNAAVQVVADRWQFGGSLEARSTERGISPKVAWKWSQKLWGMGWRELDGCCSWEGLFEKAIRRAGWTQVGADRARA